MQTINLNSASKPALAVLRELATGETCTFPASKNSYIKSICSRFGFEWNKEFKTSVDREHRLVIVERTK